MGLKSAPLCMALVHRLHVTTSFLVTIAYIHRSCFHSSIFISFIDVELLTFLKDGGFTSLKKKSISLGSRQLKKGSGLSLKLCLILIKDAVLCKSISSLFCFCIIFKKMVFVKCEIVKFVKSARCQWKMAFSDGYLQKSAPEHCLPFKEWDNRNIQIHTSYRNIHPSADASFHKVLGKVSLQKYLL